MRNIFKSVVLLLAVFAFNSVMAKDKAVVKMGPVKFKSITGKTGASLVAAQVVASRGVGAQAFSLVGAASRCPGRACDATGADLPPRGVPDAAV